MAVALTAVVGGHQHRSFLRQATVGDGFQDDLHRRIRFAHGREIAWAHPVLLVADVVRVAQMNHRKHEALFREFLSKARRQPAVGAGIPVRLSRSRSLRGVGALRPGQHDHLGLAEQQRGLTTGFLHARKDTGRIETIALVRVVGYAVPVRRQTGDHAGVAGQGFRRAGRPRVQAGRALFHQLLDVPGRCGSDGVRTQTIHRDQHHVLDPRVLWRWGGDSGWHTGAGRQQQQDRQPGATRKQRIVHR